MQGGLYNSHISQHFLFASENESYRSSEDQVYRISSPLFFGTTTLPVWPEQSFALHKRITNRRSIRKGHMIAQNIVRFVKTINTLLIHKTIIKWNRRTQHQRWKKKEVKKPALWRTCPLSRPAWLISNERVSPERNFLSHKKYKVIGSYSVYLMAVT